MKSSLMYERLAQGEITRDTTPEEQACLDAIRKEDQAYLERYPSPPVPRPRITRGIGWLSAAASAALIVWVGLSVGVPPQPDTRIKSSELSLFVYHKTTTGTELLSRDTPLGQNEEVQLAYFTTKLRYAAILSVDGRGTITTHLPLHSDQALEVQTPQPELLPYSYRLDDAPEFETVYLIASESPFSVSTVKPFLVALVTQRDRTLHLPTEFQYTEFRILKKDPTR